MELSPLVMVPLPYIPRGHIPTSKLGRGTYLKTEGIETAPRMNRDPIGLDRGVHNVNAVHHVGETDARMSPEPLPPRGEDETLYI